MAGFRGSGYHIDTVFISQLGFLSSLQQGRSRGSRLYDPLYKNRGSLALGNCLGRALTI